VPSAEWLMMCRRRCSLRPKALDEGQNEGITGMVETFPLPGSSFKILRLILIGYLHQGGVERKAAGPADIGSAIGMDATIVSRNNAFLAATGLLENEGRKWRLTEAGVTTARALEYEAEEEIQSALGQLLRGSEFVQKITTFVRGRGGVELSQLAEHVARTAGAPRKGASLTGARTIVEMLIRGAVLHEDGGVVQVTRVPRAPEAAPEGRVEGETSSGQAAKALRRAAQSGGASVTLDVRITPEDLKSDTAVDELAGRIRRLMDLLSA
jgi:hypothetical protein